MYICVCILYNVNYVISDHSSLYYIGAAHRALVEEELHLWGPHDAHSIV